MIDIKIEQPDALILASGSVYRARLLERLQIPFETRMPNVNETTRPGESAAQLAERLAVSKAQAVRDVAGDPLIIGSDQVAACDNRLLGKPGTVDNAIEQLGFCSGKHVVFFTGVAAWRPARNQLNSSVSMVEVSLRRLNIDEIESYIARDNPLDCAGSFKWESLGISLFRGMAGDDATALEGLPLITVCDYLRRHGYPLP